MKKLKSIPDLVLRRDEGTNTPSLEMRISGETSWPDVLDYFQDFLAGCGYQLPKGDIELVESEKEFTLFDPKKFGKKPSDRSGI